MNSTVFSLLYDSEYQRVCRDETRTPLSECKSECFCLQKQRKGNSSSALFSRSEYFQQVLGCSKDKLQCVMISTYRLHLQYVQSTFRELFDTNSSIRTLILHGDKNKIIPEVEIENLRTIKLSKYQMISRSIKVEMSSDADSDSEDSKNARKISDEQSKLEYHRILKESIFVPRHIVLVEEVYPQYSPLAFLDDESIKLPLSIPGVHHPKYLLLFTEYGVHVVISTANFTDNSTIDLSWCQYFKRREHISSAPTQQQTNDFGIILEDFLQKQSEQLRVSHQEHASYPEEWLNPITKSLDIMRWLKAHAGIRSSLCEEFDFSSAEVDLVSVVPARSPSEAPGEEVKKGLFKRQKLDPDLVKFDRCVRCKKDLQCLHLEDRAASISLAYGANRLCELLTRHNLLLHRALTPADHLVMQPTSIGVGVNNHYLAWLLAKYMPESGWEESDWYSLRQECWRLIWPTSSFVVSQAQRGEKKRRKIPEPNTNIVSETIDIRGSVARSISLPLPMKADSNPATIDDSVTDFLSNKRKIAEGPSLCLNDADDTFEEDSDGDVSAGAYFLHPKSFYLMEPDIHSQFHVYKHNLLQPAARDPVSTEANRVNNFLSSNCPHNKLYCRLLAPDKEAAEYLDSACPESSASSSGKRSSENRKKTRCICYDLAWCLMTSACLSKGAQGEDHGHSICEDCRFLKQFKNFELGVLFHSKPGRQYRALNGRCPVHNFSDHSPMTSSDEIDESKGDDDEEEEDGVKILPFPFEMLNCPAYCSVGGVLTKRPYFNPDNEAIKFEKSHSVG